MASRPQPKPVGAYPAFGDQTRREIDILVSKAWISMAVSS